MSSSQTHLVSSQSTSQNPSSRRSSHRLLTPTTNPVPLLSDPIAKTYSNIHTFILPLYYYVRSSALVRTPFDTLLWDLGVIAALQCAFCAVCLPRAGAWVSGTSGGAILEGSASSSAKSGKSAGGGGSATGSLRRKGKSAAAGGGAGDGSWGARVLPTVLSLILTILLPPLPLTLIALVLGAPLYPTNLLPTTLLLATHVSLLAFLPLFYTHGVSAPAWRDISAAWLPFDSAGVWGGSVGCFLGGWVGAVPMALDWDRDWQAWPCTVVWGVVVGWAVGRAITGAAGFGLGGRINMSEKEEDEVVLVERVGVDDKGGKTA